jgi:hypothetical protein
MIFCTLLIFKRYLETKLAHISPYLSHSGNKDDLNPRYAKALTVSIDGVSFSRQDIDLPKAETAGNATPLLKKMKEYQASGWEVMNLDCQMLGAGEVYFSYLRKKKAEQK